mmetsp:Transcript_12119/g.15601  ORF Transcript_12119/g.15601 Transcript_12119/m.15601 type:complete len:179 (+) Transcript_12119:77-613(+)
MSSKVLDLSFHDLDVHELASQSEPDHEENGIPSPSALRLSSNGMTDISQLFNESRSLVKEPAELKWLDLSCNDITQVPEEFIQFRETMVVYLHGNKITDFQDLLPLGRMSQLKKLTLHGNPVEDLPNYRSFVILMIPTLKMLDFSIVTKQDRVMADFFKNSFDAIMKKKNRKNKNTTD